MAKVVVIGSINMDLVVTADRFPAPGETIPGRGFSRFSGGKGANQAVAAARIGAPVVMVGAVGDDPFGAVLVDGLAADGIDVARVAVVPQTPTGTALITVAGGDNTIVVVAGANTAIPAEAAAAAPIDAGDTVCAQLEVPHAAIRAGFGRARAVGAVTVLNAAPALPEARDLFDLVDILVVNEHELAVYSGRALAADDRDAVAAAAGALVAGGVATVVVTLGGSGVLVAGRDGVVTAPGHRVPVVDTTGAGDCFVGALAAGLAAGDALAGAIRLANAAAALSVGIAGAAPSMPRRTTVEAYLAAAEA